MSHTARATLQPGAIVNDLQISAILGVGASAVTYLATDTTLGKSYALKEYFPAGLAHRTEDGQVEPADAAGAGEFAAGLEQFLDEARRTAALEHPAIVSMLRYFEANGTGYAQMAWSEGRSLRQRLEAGHTLEPDQARQLLLPLMDALEYLHRQGLVHQDVKPANVLVTSTGSPVLIDLGIAVSQQKARRQEERRGSPGYAAVEQSAIDGRVGPWTDIYGLSATLYRAITGQLPPSAVERQAAIEAGQPDPLAPFSKQAPEGQYGGIRDAIDLGLAIYPQDRPRDIDQWRTSFKSLDWHRSVVGGQGGADESAEGREWLPRILLGVFLLTMTAIAVFLATDWWPVFTTDDPVQVATPATQQTGDDPRLQEPTAEEISRWQAALDADTVFGYRRFIEDYPLSIYVSQAQTQLNILDDKAWAELSPEDSIAAYTDYLELFPDGLHQAHAMVRIDEIRSEEARFERERLEQERLENEAWEAARSERTVAALDRYLADWPRGAHVEDAHRLRRQILDRANDDKAFALARKLNTRDAMQAYIDAFPRGAHVTAALEAMDGLTLRPGRTFQDCEQCPRMTVVPAGTYWQGATDDDELAPGMEKPRRKVTIDEPFAVGVYEVSMAEWDACVGDGGCTEEPTDNGWGRGDRPVIMVSWNDVQEYLRWISDRTGQQYRLPSESQWEYVARAGEESAWQGGDPALLCLYGNIAGTETGFRWQHQQCGDALPLGTSVKGAFRANAFGLHDVIGNVAEWTADCMNLSYIDAPVDGNAWRRGICSSHMTRGGSWITGSKESRLPARFNLKNGDRNDFTGFRVVRKVEE